MTIETATYSFIIGWFATSYALLQHSLEAGHVFPLPFILMGGLMLLLTTIGAILLFGFTLYTSFGILKRILSR